MNIYCVGTARIRDRVSGVVHTIKASDLVWEIVGGDEEPMGPSAHYQASVDHPALGYLAWSLWEYPAGAEQMRHVASGPHEVIEDFSFGFKPEDPDLQPNLWVNWAVPDDPYAVFMDSHFHTGDMLADWDSAHGAPLFHRMIFAHQVTALEAYLGDTLLKQVLADPAAIQRLIELDSDLSKAKFSLVEISRDPGLVTRKVGEHLRGILFHNLAKVDALYFIALGVKVLDLAADRPRLQQAIILRHDCVHRNGRDKDGKPLTQFTKNFVRETSDLIRQFVDRVEGAIRARPRS